MKKKFMLLALIVLGGMSAFAEESPVLELKQTVVTSDSFGTPVRETAKNMTVINAKEIKEKGAKTIADQQAGLEGRVDVGAPGPRGPGDDRVGRGGDPLALDGQLAAHRLGGLRRRRRPHEPLGDQAQVGHPARGGWRRSHGAAHQKSREEGSSRPHRAS